jgi:hypothetical protein
MNRLACMFVLAACGGGSKQAPPPAEPVAQGSAVQATPATARKEPQTSVARAMAKMHEFADAMCACHDTPCAQQVADAITQWSTEEAKREDMNYKLTEAEEKEATALGTRMGECMQTAIKAGSGAAGGGATP